MQFLLKSLFTLVLVINNKFLAKYAIILKPAYFAIIALFFYHILFKLKSLYVHSKDVRPLLILLSCFSLLVISGFYNQVRIEAILYGVFPYVYIIIIYLLVFNLNHQVSTSVLLFCENLIFFNAIICFFQGGYLLFKTGQWQDWVTGIHAFGSANELGYLFLIGIVINLFYQRKTSNWKNVIYVATIFLMEAKGAALLSIIAVVIIKFDRIKNIKKFIFVMAMLLICSSIMFFTINKFTHSVHFKVDLVKAFKNEVEYHPTSSAVRLAHLIYVAKHYFPTHNLSPLFGSGIGTYESPAGYFFNSKYLRLKKILFWNKLDNVPQLTHTQIATLLAEGGYLGLLSFEIGIIAFIIGFIKQGYRYSAALLIAYFFAQIFHYIFLSFLTFIVFWPTLFIIMGEERGEDENESAVKGMIPDETD